MKDFKSGGFGGSRGGDRKSGFGGGQGGSRPSFGGGRERDSQMYKATCAECSKSCEVPFKPNGQKPVYCKDCFVRDEEPRGGFAPRRDGGDRGDRRGDRDHGPKPFPPRPPQHHAGPDEMKRSIEAISSKLDRLIGLMEKNTTSTTKVAPVVRL